jgi:hypothetical protein
LDQFYVEKIPMKKKLKKELLWAIKFLNPIKKYLKAI